MTYEKNIEDLRYLCECLPLIDAHYRAAINTAVELMRACAPKNEVTELEHCYMAMEGAPNWADHTSDQRRDWLIRERAQARGEGYAAGKHDGYNEGCKYTDSIEMLTTKLAVAQAEIDRLKALANKLVCEKLHARW